MTDSSHLAAPSSGRTSADAAPNAPQVQASGKCLHLSLKGEYFDAIRDGTKPKEYRLANDYWTKRLVGREYDRIVLTKGYPARDDHERRITREWRGYTIETLQHPHFGAEPVTVFAIDVTRPIALGPTGSPARPGRGQMNKKESHD